MQSTERKMVLSGWLKTHQPNDYAISLKLQKFLFLYEAFSKVENDNYEFTSLEGWKNGTVFCNVWNDYTKSRNVFDRSADSLYNSNAEPVDLSRASVCGFITSVLNEQELSELSHCFNIWKKEEDKIKKGIFHVKLSDDNFDDSDIKLVNMLKSMYPLDFVKNSVVLNMGNYHYVLSKDDHKRLTDAHYDALAELAENEELKNPVYVEIDEEGCLVVD